ncbi:hypothetical protein [Sphingomonas sp. BK235]|uniref:hypothetical protein n=1 Tax=Sphingomonas sp. BK235 TaxID=2512131 RepID=UPI001052D595|nr:hypothetical protein [Sphingomonas sp. BK235]
MEKGIFLVAERLQAERIAAGWSAAELARSAIDVAHEVGDQLSLTQQAVSQFENKKLKNEPKWLKYAQAALHLRRVAPAERQQFLEGWFGRISPSILPPPAEDLATCPTWLSLRVPLPSEAALASMFEAQLLVFRDLSGAELARALARRLPTGLARLQEAQLFEDPALPDDPIRDGERPAPGLTSDRQARRT